MSSMLELFCQSDVLSVTRTRGTASNDEDGRKQATA